MRYVLRQFCGTKSEHEIVEVAAYTIRPEKLEIFGLVFLIWEGFRQATCNTC